MLNLKVLDDKFKELKEKECKNNLQSRNEIEESIKDIKKNLKKRIKKKWKEN